MAEILVLGFLIGMRHALEADHVAAVAAIATGERSLGRMVRHGAVWGLGHTLTLLAVAGAALALGVAVPERLAHVLELAVGVMLVGLGGWVVWRLARDRVHFHVHRHRDGVVHFHAHSHAGETRPHDPARHDHGHPPGLPWRTLLVGMVHGTAGSAALLLLAAVSVGSGPLGLAYVAVFGVGSIAGMAALSAAIAVPLTRAARLLTWGHRALQAAVGAASAAVGAAVILDAARLLAV